MSDEYDWDKVLAKLTVALFEKGWKAIPQTDILEILFIRGTGQASVTLRWIGEHPPTKEPPISVFLEHDRDYMDVSEARTLLSWAEEAETLAKTYMGQT